jgi:hypothetical protein
MENKFYFARRCDVTGNGMNEGYCIGDGEMYIEKESDMIAHLRSLDWVDADGNLSTDIESDEELLEFFYNEEYYYHTAWEDDELEYVSDYEDGRDAVEMEGGVL